MLKIQDGRWRPIWIDANKFYLKFISYIFIQLLYIFWSNELNIILSALWQLFWKIDILRRAHTGNLGIFCIFISDIIGTCYEKFCFYLFFPGWTLMLLAPNLVIVGTSPSFGPPSVDILHTICRNLRLAFECSSKYDHWHKRNVFRSAITKARSCLSKLVDLWLIVHTTSLSWAACVYSVLPVSGVDGR